MATNLLRYRTQSGLLEEPAELLQVQGFSSVILEKLMPYVRTGKPRERLKRIYRFRNRIADEHPAREGYLGNSLRLYGRGVTTVGRRLSICILTEKDPYEPKYIDLLSLHAHLAHLGALESCVIGDYSLDFAEGVVLGEPRFMAKGSVLGKRSERGIIPKRSSVESGWMRGAAAKLERGGLAVYCFASRMRLDASLNEDGLVTAIDTDGLHRTAGEMKKVGALSELLVGARAVVRAGNLRGGLTGFGARYSPALAAGDGRRYSFSGDRYRVLGADLGFSVGPTELYLESAESLLLGQGYLLGISHREKGIDLALSFRHYVNPSKSGKSLLDCDLS